MPEINIRKAAETDKYAYADCFISCFQTAYRGIVPDDYLQNLSNEREQRADRLLRYLEIPELAVFCLMRESKMIGFLILHLSNGEIWAIYLLEELRGKGYGKAAMNFAIDELKCAGHTTISLWVLAENERAKRFYDKYGFYFSGETRENTNYGKLLAQHKYVLN